MAETDNAEKELTPAQRRAVAAMLSARSVKEAAELAGVGERTLHRWLEQPKFYQTVQAAEGVAIDAATRRLVALADSAVDTLADLLADDETPARLRLAAASEVLSSMLKLRELRNIEARLAALEAAYAEHNQKAA